LFLDVVARTAEPPTLMLSTRVVIIPPANCAGVSARFTLAVGEERGQALQIPLVVAAACGARP
jgi:hypothetical protein